MLNEMFLYPKIRGNFLNKIYYDRPLRKVQMDILLYIRYFANSDGWVMNAPLKEYMNYDIWRGSHRKWRFMIYSLIEKDLIQMRTRQSKGSKERAKLNKEGKSGSSLEYKLTAKGSLLLREFDEESQLYIDKHLLHKKARAIGADDDIFNLGEDGA